MVSHRTPKPRFLRLSGFRFRLLVLFLLLSVVALFQPHRVNPAPVAKPYHPWGKPTATATVTAPRIMATAPAPVISVSNASGCTPLDKNLGMILLDKPGPGLDMRYVRGMSTYTPDYGGLHFISVEFAALGIGNQALVFAAPTLTGEGVQSVDSMAKVFTLWPDVKKAHSGISTYGPDMIRAIECLK